MSFEKRSVAPSKSDQILVSDVNTGISFHVNDAMTNLVVQTLYAEHKRVHNRLLLAHQSLLGRIVKKVVRSPQKLPKLTKPSLIDPDL